MSAEHLSHAHAACAPGRTGAARFARDRGRAPLSVSVCAAAAVSALMVGSAQLRPRARDLGITPGVHPPGVLNAITDVAGVRVGHTTVIEGDSVRTGVTAVVPHAGNLFQDKVAGAVFVGNAFGKLAGSTQVAELGTIETPIVLTNTLSVYNSLLQATSVTSVFGSAEAIPVEKVRDLIKK
jgi:D-aminopeptidase